MVDTTLIINTMKDWVENKQPISPHLWLDASAKLNILRGDLDDSYYTLEHDLAVEKAALMSDPEMTAAKSDIFIRARKEFKECRQLGAKIKQVEEFIRIAKKMASLKEEEFIHS